MDVNEDGVYELITKLCEKTCAARKVPATTDVVKRLRSTAYEILLGKRLVKQDVIVCLKGNDDPYCQLLAWKFTLVHNYQLHERATKLQRCVDALEKSENVRNILRLFLQLKQAPTDDSMKLEDTRFFRMYEPSKFRLPCSFICANSRYSNKSFELPTKLSGKSVIRIKARSNSSQSCKSLTQTSKRAEPPESPVTEEFDLWEFVSKIDYNDRRTWETLGDPTPEKELPFATESTANISSLLYDQEIYLYGDFLPEPQRVYTELIEHRQFIRDMKNILVGIVSNTFIYGENGGIILKPGVAVEGVSCSAMQAYCKEIIFCGTCYKALGNMVAVDPYTGNHKHAGYIFSELCESIKRYLSYYRVAALSLPDSHGLLQHHDHIRELSSQLHVLSSVCKVGPFAESEQIPHGVALLNYLYERVLGLSNANVIMVLYSVLYPCLQVYFNHFLRQWILEGCVIDPYNEFFIMATHKYLSSRGRTYWTRSYTIREDIVPEFLSNLRAQILNCGKAMNLLKLCVPNSPTCKYLMGKKPNLLQCCLTSDQLEKLENNVRLYHLEVIAESGPRFSMETVITRGHEQEEIFLNLVAKKRANTMKLIELQKLRRAEAATEKKLEEMRMLREQYEAAVIEREAAKAAELQRELELNDKLVKMRKLEEKIIKDEMEDIVKHYNKLFEECDKREESKNKYVNYVKRIHLEGEHSRAESSMSDTFESVTSEPVESLGSNTSVQESNYASPNISEIKENSLNVAESDLKIEEVESESVVKELTDAERNKLKVLSSEFGLGANLKERDKLSPNLNVISDAQRNKMKVMGVEYNNYRQTKIETPKVLTEAQRNKLKIMSTEYGTEVAFVKPERTITPLEINRNHNLASNECFTYTAVDNENFLNKNVVTPEQEINKNYIIVPEAKKPDLRLDFRFKRNKSPGSLFESFMKSPNFEFQKPMSVDSTPVIEFTPLPPDSATLQTLSTAASNFTDEGGFNFPLDKDPVFANTLDTDISKRFSRSEVRNISIHCMNYFIQQSIVVPISIQSGLVQNELLKYFINDLKYLEHLHSLRDYFFLLDGEFGRSITEGLFEKLYDVDSPKDLINFRTLKNLVFDAVERSKFSEHSKCLSFKIPAALPKRFDLGDVAVLDCLSLSYNITWPLNILFPSDTIGKYDEVFKFVLKLHRVSWVVKKIFMEMKLLVKRVGEKELYLTLSPQYQKLHQFRHIITHFVQTLQNYVVGEVLQTSWANFEENLTTIGNLDQLYALHTAYIKKILFMCLLNQRSAPIRKVLHNIFTVILKFYDYLRARDWEFEDSVFVHPNYRKLEAIFNNFMEFVQFMFRAGRKVARTGYQPQLAQLVDMLDVNEFYSKRNAAQQ